MQGTSKQVYERPVLRTVNARTSTMLCLSNFPEVGDSNQTEDYGRTTTETTKSWWF